jgi:hypothetical protein
MQSTSLCTNNPDSWFRASAQLDKASGQIAVSVQLESDSVTEGPSGRALVELKGAEGQVLASVVSAEIGIGGKSTPRSIDSIQRSYTITIIPHSVATRTASMVVTAQCTGVVI